MIALGFVAPGLEIDRMRTMESTARRDIAVKSSDFTKPSEHGSSGPSARTVIRPLRGWRLVNLRELWRYRELLYFLALREVKVRYKQTLLGAAWAVLQPAMMMVVFTVFLGRLAHVPSADYPYPLFVYAGLLPWTFFATAVANAGNSVVGSERLITKIYFPRLAIPFAAVGAALIDFLIAFGMLVALMAWYRILPGPAVALVPVLVALFALAALGMGTLLAALNVAYRDFRYVMPFLMQLWMFATPTVYMATAADERDAEPPAAVSSASAAPVGRAAESASAEESHNPGVPSWIKSVLKLNPLTGLVGVFRAAMLGGPVSFERLGLSALGAVTFFIAGCLYFRRVEDSFADII
jgi:lipopolysaccharide transport system permease protein